MKSFSEYIREAVDFRLGGNQQKGFDQEEKYKDMPEALASMLIDADDKDEWMNATGMFIEEYIEGSEVPVTIEHLSKFYRCKMKYANPKCLKHVLTANEDFKYEESYAMWQGKDYSLVRITLEDGTIALATADN